MEAPCTSFIICDGYHAKQYISKPGQCNFLICSVPGIAHESCSRISWTNCQNGREQTKVDLRWIVYLPRSMYVKVVTALDSPSTANVPRLVPSIAKVPKYIKSVSNRSATSYIYRHSSIAILRYKNLITSICKRISKKSYPANPVMHCLYLLSSNIHIPDICHFFTQPNSKPRIFRCASISWFQFVSEWVFQIINDNQWLSMIINDYQW